MAVYLNNTQVPDLIRNATVPVYGAHHDYPLVQDRSGVLVRLGDRHYILTAAHELEKWLSDDKQLHPECALFVSTTDQAFHERYHRGPETVELKAERLVILEEPTIDVAAIEISQDTATRLDGVKTFLSLVDIRGLPTPSAPGRFLAYGHPFALADAGAPGDAVQIVTSPVAWFDTHALPSDLRPNHDPHKQILCHLPLDPRLVEGAEDPHEPAKGFSGSGIWYCPHHDGSPLLVGIFVRQCAPQEYLVATTLKCVLDSLVEHYPDIAQDISSLRPLPT